MPDHKKLEILRQLRKAQDITLAEMAAYFGFEKSARDRVSQWETGEDVPALQHRATFIRYLCQELGLRSDRERFDEVWQVVSEQWKWPRITEHEWQEGSAVPSDAAPVQDNVGNEAEKPDIALRGNEAIVPELPLSRSIRRQRYGARLGLLIVLGGVLAVLITLLRSVLSPSPVESKVLITEPKDGDTVERQIVVKGTFENLPEGMSIWVYVITDEHRYYPKRVDRDRTRSNGWIVKDVRVGDEGQGDMGKRFPLGVFLATGQDFTYLDGIYDDGYGAELEETGELPARFLVLHTINVCREISC